MMNQNFKQGTFVQFRYTHVLLLWRVTSSLRRLFPLACAVVLVVAFAVNALLAAS